MHIGIAIQHFHAQTGGAEGFAVLVARQLAARGHRLDVIAETGAGFPGVTVHLAPMADWNRRASEISPDLLIDWGLNVPADLHRLGGGTHLEYQRISLEARPEPLRTLKRWGYRLSARHRQILREEDALIRDPRSHFLAVSTFVADQLRRTAPVAEARITVIINGVDTERFNPEALHMFRGPTRETLGLSGEKVICLLVAHNLWLKNFALLRDVFPSVVSRESRAHLVLVGKRDPGFRAPWFTYARATAKPEHLYAAADVLLHPTRYDACANVVLEAMACARPVISSDRNGSAEAIDPNHTGWVLPVVGNASEIRRCWSEAITELVVDQGQRERMGLAARERVLAKYTVSAYVDHLEQLLQGIADKGGRMKAEG